MLKLLWILLFTSMVYADMDFTSEKFNKFRLKLIRRESNGNYKAINSIGALGAYQIMPKTLEHLGYIKDGKWTGKQGLKSKFDFLNNTKKQDACFYELMMDYKKQLKRFKVYDYIGKVHRGIEITETGLLGSAHLAGASGVSNMLKNGTKGKCDIHNTCTINYLKYFKDVE